MTTRLRVESDGDRYPKDVYLVNESGERVATMETGFPFTENQAFKLARAICRAFNGPGRKRHAEPEKTVCEDGDVFHPPCPECGSRSTDCGCD